MNQHLHFAMGGIQCDTEGCDYRDDTIKVEDYPEWLNKPCPTCNGNLLTQADFDQIQFLLETVKQINSMSPEQLKELGVHMDDEIVHGEIEMDGTGKVEFKIKE